MTDPNVDKSSGDTKPAGSTKNIAEITKEAAGKAKLARDAEGAAQQDETAPTDKEFAELLIETEALALYVGRHGNILDQDHMAIYEQLLSAQGAATNMQNTATWAALMEAYAKLSAETYKSKGVNGRTILDTQAPRKQGFWQRAVSPRRRPLYIGLCLFALALVFELLANWAGGVSDPSTLTGIRSLVYSAVDALGTFLIPATWGGIGSCIFLTKRLSDKLFDMAYEEDRLKGDGTRIFLGAMLGVIVVVLFFPDFSEKIQVGEVSFGPATAAFLAGLGVKPIYGAFEALSNALADRIAGRK
jgi:hypothetical protein